MSGVGRRFARWRKLPFRRKVVAFVFGLALAALLVWGLEQLGQTLYEIKMDYYGVQDIWDYEAGTEKVYKDGELVIDVTFKIDSYGRRDTYQPDLQSGVNQYGIFLGCSYTFGHGVNSDETLPSRVAARLPNYRIMNYGQCGSSPNIILKQITDPMFREGFAERSGFVVYTFIDDHVPRTAGAYEKVGDSNPYYRLTENGGLAPVTNFEEWQPGARLMHTTVSQSGIAKYLNSGAPPEMTDKDYVLTARVIEELSVVMKRDYGAEHFVILFYPDSYLHDKMAPLLEGKGMTLLNYFEMLGGSIDDHKTLAGHPSAMAHDRVAERLVRDLREKGFVKTAD